jgi:hypothetical protein
LVNANHPLSATKGVLTHSERGQSNCAPPACLSRLGVRRRTVLLAKIPPNASYLPDGQIDFRQWTCGGFFLLSVSLVYGYGIGFGVILDVLPMK